MARVGSVAINLTARTNAFVKGMNRAADSVSKFARVTFKATRRIIKFSVVLAGVGVAGLSLLVRRSFKAGDALAKVADTLGMTTERLVAFRLAAAFTGVGNKTLEKSFLNMSKVISEAVRGLGIGRRALDQLGLSARDLAVFTPDEMLLRVARAMQNVSLHADKVRIAYELFGGSNVALLNTLPLVATGMASVENEAKKLGLALTRIETAKIEAANLAIKRLMIASRGLGNVIAVELSPIIIKATNQFIEWGKSGTGASGKVRAGIIFVEAALGVLGDSAWAFGRTWIEVTNFFRIGIATMEVGIWGLAKSVAWVADKIIQSFRSVTDRMDALTRKARLIFDVINQVTREVLSPRESFEAGKARIDAIFARFESRERILQLQTGKSFMPMFNRALDDKMAALSNALKKAKKELDAFDMMPKPSNLLAQWLADARKEAQELAEAIADAKKIVMKPLPDFPIQLKTKVIKEQAIRLAPALEVGSAAAFRASFKANVRLSGQQKMQEETQKIRENTEDAVRELEAIESNTANMQRIGVIQMN